MEIRQEIKRRAADIEARIAPFLPQEKGFQQTVLDAMEYSVFAGGKRLRPMLMEASYQMFDGTNPAIDDFMAAIEMIHTYSLMMIFRLWITTNTGVGKRQPTRYTGKQWQFLRGMRF